MQHPLPFLYDPHAWRRPPVESLPDQTPAPETATADNPMRVGPMQWLFDGRSDGAQRQRHSSDS